MSGIRVESESIFEYAYMYIDEHNRIVAYFGSDVVFRTSSSVWVRIREYFERSDPHFTTSPSDTCVVVSN